MVINQYFPPDRSATAGILERIAIAFSTSYHVLIIAGRPSYFPLKRQRWRPITLSIIHRITVLRVGSTDFHRYSKIKRIANYLSYLILSFPVSLFASSDIIIAMTDPPLAGLIGIAVAKLKRVPLIYYIQDLHPDMAIAAGMIREGGVAKLWSILNAIVIKNADRIMVIGEDMKDRIKKKGISNDKIAVVRHGVSNRHYLDIDSGNNVIVPIKRKHSFIFMHAGNIGNYGPWGQIVDAIKIINNDDIGFVFIGEGQLKEFLRTRCLGLKNTYFFPYQAREHFNQILRSGDVQMVSIKKHLEGLVVPSKIYPILGAKKPVLGICPASSDTAQIINKFQCGLIADPESPESIANAMSNFYRNRNQLHVYEANSEKAAYHYDQNVMQSQLIQEVEKLLPMNL